MKKFLAALLSCLVVTASLPFSMSASATTVRRCQPKATGSFIQGWFCSGWDDARWDQELTAMQQAGLTYLVFGDTASRNSSDVWETYYPSTVSELSGATYYGNVVDTLLRKCQQYNIKVFLGMGMYNEFWVNGGIGSTYTDFCNISAKIAEDLYNQYHSRYPNSFYGWYFVPEFDNNYLNMTPFVSKFASGMNVIISKLNQLNTNMPMMMSPYYMKYYTTTNVADTKTFWLNMFSQINFRQGDIFSPQDAVGAGWIAMTDLEMITQMYRQVVDESNKGVILWSNCEDFTSAQSGTIGGPPKTENTVVITNTLDRYAQQLDVASKYADNIITFAWNHYYSPYNVDAVYNNTYLNYIQNGYVLESQKPAPPTKVSTALQSDGSLQITWNDATDNIGIAAYRVYKSGSLLARNDCIIGGTKGISKTATDSSFSTSGQTQYQIEAIDGAGNVSDRVSITVNGSNPDSYVDYSAAASFKTICDSELIPAGTKPGINDTTGYYNSITGNGQNYLINTVNGVGYQGSRGIQYSVPSGASADTWVSFRLLSPSYNNSSAHGATDLCFWIDTTGFGSKQFSHTLYFSENDTAGNETTIWTLKSSGNYYIENGSGGFMKTAISSGYLTYPTGYKGFVRVPYDAVTPTWGTSDSNGQFGLDSFNYILLAFNSWKADAGKSIVFDHFGFVGNVTGGTTVPTEFNRYTNKTATDFSLVPNGTKPGVNDTAGYFNNISGNGTNYLLQVTNGIGYKGGRGLQYSIPSGASANAWVSFKIQPASFNLQQAAGAKELYFWIDTTNFTDSFQNALYFSEYDQAANETTVWGLNSTGTFYIEDGCGGFKTASISNGYLTYPTGYKGFVKVPFSVMSPQWGTADTNSQVGLSGINYIQLAFNSWKSDAGESVLFDQFGFNGIFADGTRMPTQF